MWKNGAFFKLNPEAEKRCVAQQRQFRLLLNRYLAYDMGKICSSAMKLIKDIYPKYAICISHIANEKSRHVVYQFHTVRSRKRIRKTV